MNVVQTIFYLLDRNRMANAMAAAAAVTTWREPLHRPRLHLTPDPLPSIQGWPVNGIVTSRFGRRRRPRVGASTNHQGVDIAARTGTPVCATADGYVSAAGMRGGYGLTVVLEHGNELQTSYAHLSAAYVHAGESVTRGQMIGAVGSSGISTGPHLHFEVRRSGRAVDPGLVS